MSPRILFALGAKTCHWQVSLSRQLAFLAGFNMLQGKNLGTKRATHRPIVKIP